MIELTAKGSYYERFMAALDSGLLAQGDCGTNCHVCRHVSNKHGGIAIVGSKRYCGDKGGAKACQGKCCAYGMGTFPKAGRTCDTCESPCPAMIEFLDDKGV